MTLVATSLLALTIVEPEIGSDHRETSNIDNILVFPFRYLSMYRSQLAYRWKVATPLIGMATMEPTLDSGKTAYLTARAS